MGKPIIRILYFQRRGIDANGYYRLNYIIQRGRKILYYATETKDFEYSDCFTLEPNNILYLSDYQIIHSILIVIWYRKVPV